MMDFEQFKDYVVDNIKDYLPSDYEDAEVNINIVTKSSDVELSGLMITREGSNMTPNIYLESFYKGYKDGEEITEVLEKMSYIKSGEPGKGLLWVEGVKVPFEDDFPKDTTCYKLMTTRPGER